MYIYSKPHTPRPGEEEDAERDSARHEHPLSPSPSGSSSPTGHAANVHSRLHSTSAVPSQSSKSKPAPSDPGVKPRRTSFPPHFPFPPLFQQNASSASLAPSTAEGKPIPLDNNTAAHRTSALQKLNSTYPSEVRRHRYAKSAGAQSSTYSQPVLVRTYSGPPPSQSSINARGSRYRPPSSSRGASRRVPLPLSTRQSSVNASSRPTQPALSGINSGNLSSGQSMGESERRGYGPSMPRHKPQKSSGKLPMSLPLPLPWHWQSSGRQEHDDARLPPLEAFSFKSFMADMQTRGGEDDIGADLDRIAEICARSRYSLSNQYEVHVTPHGSGASFSTAGKSGHRRRSHNRAVGGPTLQAFNSDDDDGSAARSHRKRRSGGRRKSVAYGTLETIMSSSRSSEEDKTKKKPAADIVGEIRGRAGKNWDSSTASGSKSELAANLSSGNHDKLGQESGLPSKQGPKGTLARKKSASFATAVIDSGRCLGKNDTTAALVSEPALPQTSNTNLGVRTASDAGDSNSPPSGVVLPNPQVEVHLADELPHQEDNQEPVLGLHVSWSDWLPWRTQSKNESNVTSITRDVPSHAEGSLRLLLKSADSTSDKGKGTDREGR